MGCLLCWSVTYELVSCPLSSSPSANPLLTPQCDLSADGAILIQQAGIMLKA